MRASGAAECTAVSVRFGAASAPGANAPPRASTATSVATRLTPRMLPACRRLLRRWGDGLRHRCLLRQRAALALDVGDQLGQAALDRTPRRNQQLRPAVDLDPRPAVFELRAGNRRLVRDAVEPV